MEKIEIVEGKPSKDSNLSKRYEKLFYIEKDGRRHTICHTTRESAEKHVLALENSSVFMHNETPIKKTKYKSETLKTFFPNPPGCTGIKSMAGQMRKLRKLEKLAKKAEGNKKV